MWWITISIVFFFTILMTVSLYRDKIYDLTNIQKDSGKIKWPPRIAKCPDFWDVVINDSNDEVCESKSSINIGKCKETGICDGTSSNQTYSDCKQFNMYEQDKATKREKRDQRKKAWRCKVNWDGIYG